MGCFSSKSVEPANSSNRVGNHVSQGSRQKRISGDSGISLETEEIVKSADEEQIANHIIPKKGISFNIPTSSKSIIRSHPPKRLTSRLEVSKNTKSTLEPFGSNLNRNEQIRQLVLKQVQAEKLREQERHSIVARQKRREDRAHKVQERKKKMMEKETEVWGDDDLSEIEDDLNFNTNEGKYISAMIPVHVICVQSEARLADLEKLILLVVFCSIAHKHTKLLC
ncbi:uncharacterized protein LOC120346066 isoform X1 [Styela clava]